MAMNAPLSLKHRWDGIYSRTVPKQAAKDKCSIQEGTLAVMLCGATGQIDTHGTACSLPRRRAWRDCEASTREVRSLAVYGPARAFQRRRARRDT
jgi:hypothetical protein